MGKIPDESAWVLRWAMAGEYREDLYGVGWHDARRPRRWHRCRPQTRGVFSSVYTERCACGALRSSETLGRWVDRNTRKWK